MKVEVVHHTFPLVASASNYNQYPLVDVVDLIQYRRMDLAASILEVQMNKGSSFSYHALHHLFNLDHPYYISKVGSNCHTDFLIG